MAGDEAAAVDLFTPAVVPAHPAVIAIALLLERLRRPRRSALPRPRSLNRPANSAAPPWTNCISRRSTCSASSQCRTPSTMRRRAYNLLGGMGEERHSQSASRGSAHSPPYEALTAGRGPSLAVQVIHAPVFHGHTFSIAVELERPVEIVALEEALTGEHVELVLEDTDSPSNLAATGQNDVLVRLRPELVGRNSSQTSRLWLWAAADNLRLNAQNAVQCALDLRRLRPQGTVQ